MTTKTPLLIKLAILTLFLLLHPATSSYPSHSSPSPSPSSSPSPLDESPLTLSPSPPPTQSYSPPAPPSQSSNSPTPPPTSEPTPTPNDDTVPTPPPVVEEGATDDKSMNIVTEETKKKTSGGNGVGVAFGLIGAACLVIFGGSVYKKRRDNIRRSRRYSAANIQLI